MSSYEDDTVYFRVLNAIQGAAVLTPDGRSVLFTPPAGYGGAASFQVAADDGYGSSAPTTVSVNVSTAPLVHLDFQVRNPRLVPGQTQRLVVLGDFADQEDVLLPASYLTFVSTVPSVAPVASNGQVTAVTNGSSVVVASHGTIQAATAVSVGIPTEVNQQLLMVLGLNVYPEAPSLPSSRGTRQLSASLRGEIDLSAAPGTSYYVTNPAIATVGTGGMITARGVGSTTVTVIHGPVEKVLPLQVVAAQAGPASLDALGGVVQGADGSVVQVPPGALSQKTRISIAPVPQAALPMALPEWLRFGASVQLDLGVDPLSRAALLAVRMPAGVGPGTSVYIYMASTLPNESGVEVPVWLQVDVGIVGTDGFARTTSPPFPGLLQTGLYVFLLASFTISSIALLSGSLILGADWG